MPKIVDTTAQRREIRGAARRVFARRGVAGTGLAHVAEAAGMARSSLYHYYPDRAALVRDLVGDVLAEEEALFASALRGAGTPLERIERLAGLLTGVFEAWAAIGPLLFDLWSRNARRFRPFFRRIRRDLAALISEGQRSGDIDPQLDPPLAAATVIGAIDGLLLQHLVDPKAFPDAVALREALVRSVRKLLAP
jgi:AcrR family transcriptional regulator